MLDVQVGTTLYTLSLVAIREVDAQPEPLLIFPHKLRDALAVRREDEC